METHRSSAATGGGRDTGRDRDAGGGCSRDAARGRDASRGTGRGRDREPLDAAWLEGHALRYAARWETTRRGVAELLERKIRERCERTGESPEAALDRVPGIVEGLVARRYVDDRRFATQLVLRLRRQGRSRAQIQMQLRRKGVPDAIILEWIRNEATIRADDEAGDETGDRDGGEGRGNGQPDDEPGGETAGEQDAELRAAWRFARRRRLGPHCPDPERRAALRERHLAALARQGFSREIAESVIDGDRDRNGDGGRDGDRDEDGKVGPDLAGTRANTRSRS